jgi:hypothetical protein
MATYERIVVQRYIRQRSAIVTLQIGIHEVQAVGEVIRPHTHRTHIDNCPPLFNEQTLIATLVTAMTWCNREDDMLVTCLTILVAVSGTLFWAKDETKRDLIETQFLLPLFETRVKVDRLNSQFTHTHMFRIIHRRKRI